MKEGVFIELSKDAIFIVVAKLKGTFLGDEQAAAAGKKSKESLKYVFMINSHFTLFPIY